MSALRFTLLVMLAAGPAAARDKVVIAKENAVRFLRVAEDNRGNFEHTALVVGRVRPGGLTALATVALLRTGVPANDTLVQRCLRFLRALPPEQSYTVGLQTMAFCLAKDPADRPLVQRNLNWLSRQWNPTGWGYDAQSKSPDHSINFYVLLGMREAHRAGFRLDAKQLRTLREYYRTYQEGRWNYRGDGRPTLTMTTEGLYSLLVLSELLGQKPAAGDNAIAGKSLLWLGQAFPNDIDKAPHFPHPFYCLHGVRQMADLTGQAKLGATDWRVAGRKYLLATQQPDGSWKGNGGFDHWPPVATSLALLFLAKSS